MSEVIKHECGIALIRLLEAAFFTKKKIRHFLLALQRLHLVDAEDA